MNEYQTLCHTLSDLIEAAHRSGADMRRAIILASVYDAALLRPYDHINFSEGNAVTFMGLPVLSSFDVADGKPRVLIDIQEPQQ